MSNQIQLKGQFRREEAYAASTIKPGMLLELDSDEKVKPHDDEGDLAERAFAVEDALQGNSIDDDYDTDDLVSYNLVEPGAVVYAWMEGGEDVDVGDKLTSKGNGKLKEDTGEDDIIAIALEEFDDGDDGRIPVRVL